MQMLGVGGGRGGGRGGGGGRGAKRGGRGGAARRLRAARRRATDGDAGGGARIAVCVVGQLSRLEIDSKIEYVLQPTAARRPAPAALDVFLALEEGSFLYSNLDFGAILAQQHASCGPQRMTRAVAEAQLKPWLRGASYTNHTTRAIDLGQWRRYRKDRPTAERQTRLQHHLSQFAHMRTCAQLIEDAEVENGRHYDLILKMRDNTVAVSPVVLGAPPLGPSAPKALSKRCVEWGGYNDKAMFIPRRFMGGALRAPAEDFFLVPDTGRGIPNSERLLRKVLDRHRVKVDRVARSAPARGWPLLRRGVVPRRGGQGLPARRAGRTRRGRARRTT